MRYAPFCLALLMLAGCASGPSIYEANSFDKLAWANKPFDQIKARCQHTSLHHNRQWDAYEVSRPEYKSCMEHYGYRYRGSSDIIGNDVAPSSHDMNWDNKSLPADPAVDKSALYR